MKQTDFSYDFTPEQKNRFCLDMSEFLFDIVIQCRAESREHLWYVREYTRILAEAYAKIYRRSKLTSRKQDIIVMAAPLHDIGKITIPDFIMDKPGHLSMSEINVLKKHTIKGGQIIKSMSWNVDRDFCRICYNICLYHHEKYDGSGYPYGLKAEKIPIEAQLVGLADMYDILIHSNVNKKAMEKPRAYYMLMNDKCGAISPRMKECFEYAKETMEQVEYIN